MGLALHIEKVSIEEYLEDENRSEIRREYVNGQVFAMAGASKRHNQLCGKLYRTISDTLNETDCDVFMESVKVRADDITIYYPDVVVTCEQSDDAYVLYQPILIIEVISPSSERTDRYEKLQVYRRMPSLREYAIVWQEEMMLEIHRRTIGDEWQAERYTSPSAIIRFDSINAEIGLADIYENVNF